MTLQKKILAPVTPDGNYLHSLRYAMALAERLGARVYILQLKNANRTSRTENALLDETLVDVINSARQAGIAVSHHIVSDGFGEEIVNVAKREGVDVVVLDADSEQFERLLMQVRPLVASQIIEVREKDGVALP